MSNNDLGKAVLELTTNSGQFFADLDKAKAAGEAMGASFAKSQKEIEGFGDVLQRIGEIAEGVGLGEALEHGLEKSLELLEDVPGKIVELGERGAVVQGVEAAFEGFSGSVAHATKNLEALRQGTAGTVDDFKLMQTANQLLADGVKLSADNFQTLASGARLLATQTGGSTAQALDELSRAMVTGHDKTLNLIGVHINADAALEHYAGTIGRSVADLSSQDKIAANVVAVLGQLKQRTDDAGDAGLSFAEKIQKGEAALSNLEDAVAKGIATSPVLAAGMDAAGKAITQAFGSSPQAAVKNIISLVETAAIVIVDMAGTGVEGARVIGNAWFDMDAFASLAVKGWLDDQVKAMAVLDGLTAALAKIPGPQQVVFQAAHEQMQLAIADVATLDVAVTKHLDSSGAAAGTFNKTLDALHSGLTGVESAMELATISAGKVETSTRAAGVAGSDAAGGLTKSQQKLQDEVRQLVAEFDAYEAKTSTLQATLKFGGQFDAVAIKALGLKVNLDTLVAGYQVDADKIAKTQFALVSDAMVAKTREGVGNLIVELEKLPGQGTSAFATLIKEAQDFDTKLTQSSMSGSALRIAQINAEEKAKLDEINKTSSGNAMAQAMDIAAATAYYQHLRELANGTADTIQERMQRQGVFTQQVLDKNAGDATRDYQQMLAAGTFTAEELQAAWQRMVAANVAAGHGWLQAFQQDLGKVGASILGAFASGGSIGQAAISGAQTLGGDVSKQLLKGTVDDLAKSGHGALSSALGDLAGPLGGAAVTLGLDIGKKLWNAVFGTAGRDAVVAFADSEGGFDALHQKLLTTLTGGVGEQFWIQLTQEVGKNDAAGAQAVIAKIQAAFAAAAANSPEAMASDAGYQTIDQLQAVADKAKQVYDYMVSSGKYTAAEIADAFQKMSDAQKATFSSTAQAMIDAMTAGRDAAQKTVDALTSQIQSLQQSVDAEAPEETMGIIEANQRAQLASLKQQQSDAQTQLDEWNQKIQDATDAAVKAAQDASEAAGKATVGAIQDALDGADFHVKVTVDTVGLPAPKPQAEGGSYHVTTPTLFLAGEAGPEDAMFSGANRDFSGGGGPGGGQATYITNITTLDGRVIARSQVRHLASTLANGGLRR